MRLLFAVMAVSSMFVSSTIALSEPRSAKDCASIEESFAYNECIAKFGPSGSGKIASHTPGTVIANAPANDAPLPPGLITGSAPPPPRAAAVTRSAPPARVSGSILQRRTNGRYFAVFQVGHAAAAPRAAPVPRRAAPVWRAAPGAAPKVYTAAAQYSRWRQYRRH